MAAIFSRERKDISQTALARRIGVSQSQMSDYLRGERPMTLEEIDAICDALGLDILVVIEEADRTR